MTSPTSEIDPANDPAWPGPRTDGASPQNAFRVPFSIGTGLALTLWTFFAQVLVGVVFQAAGADLDDEVVFRVLVVASQVTTFVGVLLGLRSTGRLSWRLLGPVRPQGRDVGVGLAAGLAGYAIVIAWALAWATVFGEPEPIEQSLLEGVDASTAVIALSFVIAVLLAPVVEETVYRGVLFQASRRHLGLVPGLLLSAAVFTAVHVELYPPIGSLQPVGLGGLFLLAVWLAAVHHRTGSLLVPVVAHGVFNALNLSLAVWGS